MKQLKIISMAFAFSMMFGSMSHAGVQFLPGMDSSVGSYNSSYQEKQQTNADKCRAAGYSTTYCSSGRYLTNECPYDRNYYKSCCPEGYRYTREDCYNNGFRVSRDTCGGLYQCL